MTTCIIFNDDQRKVVDSGVLSGELFDEYGPTKGYKDGYELRPIRRADDAQGNKRYIVGVQVLTALDDAGASLTFGTAVPFMSGLPQMDSAADGFPGEYIPPS